MSFSQRPPMGIPPIPPPGMMPQYGYPMGMMPPMGMGMMPMMRGPPPLSTPSSNQVPPPGTTRPKSLVPQTVPKADGEDRPPVTTVFVGNISDRAPDAMIRTMLQRCGNVLSWKRIQGASGKLQAFGFCEYEQPEATLRCIRLLNEWKIADKSLVVKVDAKTKSLLDEYKKKKKKDADATSNGEDKEKKKTALSKDKEEKEEGEEEEDDGEVKDDEEDEEEELDEFTLREDRVAQAGLDAIMREYAEDLSKAPVTEEKDEKKDLKKKLLKMEPVIRGEGIEDMELEEDKKDLINREIRSFRETHKGDEELLREKDRERDIREREMRTSRKREVREDDRERERDRDRRDRDRERRERERARVRTRSRSRSPPERSRSRTRERTIDRDYERERERDWDMDAEDEEEAYERRKQERRLREKEAVYQELLKKWESRERKRAREYEKEEEREDERRAEEMKEARRLKEFLEDYDDDKDDLKFYKGSALSRRLKEREKEMELDDRDRQRERDELEEIRRKLTEEGHTDVEEQMAKIERERDEHLLPRMNKSPERPPEPVKEEPPEPEPQPEAKVKQVSRSPSPDSDNASPGIVYPEPPSDHNTESQTSVPDHFPLSSTSSPAVQIGFGTMKPMSLNSPHENAKSSSSNSSTISKQRKKMSVVDVFNQEDDEEQESQRKLKLMRLDDDGPLSAASSNSTGAAPLLPLQQKPTTAEEKRRCIKSLIERIPTGKDELFAYQLDWTMVDSALMAKRIKPWVNKKIVEYIGEEEPSLSDFICQKVMEHSTPKNVLQDISMVLDEEAEVFVVKMWRLLIYETEAKKLGLVK